MAKIFYMGGSEPSSDITSTNECVLSEAPSKRTPPEAKIKAFVSAFTLPRAWTPPTLFKVKPDSEKWAEGIKNNLRDYPHKNEKERKNFLEIPSGPKKIDPEFFTSTLLKLIREDLLASKGKIFSTWNENIRLEFTLALLSWTKHVPDFLNKNTLPFHILFADYSESNFEQIMKKLVEVVNQTPGRNQRLFTDFISSLKENGIDLKSKSKKLQAQWSLLKLGCTLHEVGDEKRASLTEESRPFLFKGKMENDKEELRILLDNQESPFRFIKEINKRVLATNLNFGNKILSYPVPFPDSLILTHFRKELFYSFNHRTQQYDPKTRPFGGPGGGGGNTGRPYLVTPIQRRGSSGIRNLPHLKKAA